MRRFRFLILPASVLFLASAFGCEDQWFDYYPRHETPTTQPDVVKSGVDYYGGHDSQEPIVIPGHGAATNPGGAFPTTSSGLP